MREPDRKEFEAGMEKEIKNQFENGNFTEIRKSEVPEGQTILPAVWQMQRKRDARIGRIKKYKAHKANRLRPSIRTTSTSGANLVYEGPRRSQN